MNSLDDLGNLYVRQLDQPGDGPLAEAKFWLQRPEHARSRYLVPNGATIEGVNNWRVRALETIRGTQKLCNLIGAPANTLFPRETQGLDEAGKNLRTLFPDLAAKATRGVAAVKNEIERGFCQLKLSIEAMRVPENVPRLQERLDLLKSGKPSVTIVNRTQKEAFGSVSAEFTKLREASIELLGPNTTVEKLAKWQKAALHTGAIAELSKDPRARSKQLGGKSKILYLASLTRGSRD